MMNNSYEKVRTDLESLINRLQKRKERLQALSRSYSNYRLLLLLAGVIIFFSLFFSVSDKSALISAGVFLLAFAVMAHLHNRLDNGIKKLDLWTKIKSTNLARMNLDWKNIPRILYGHEDYFDDRPGPVETDLNLAGDESLHQLINTGTSGHSGSLLRTWLHIKDPDVEEIKKRQSLVKELIPLTRFRDKLALYSSLSSKREFNGDMILKLLNKKSIIPASFKLIFGIMIFLAPINIILFFLFIDKTIPPYWVITTLLYIILFHFNNKEKDKILDEAEYISDELEKIGSVFEYLERYPYKSNSGLAELCSPFRTKDERPSVLINKIRSAVGYLRIRKGNPFVWNMVRAAFPADFYFRLKLNRYKTLVSGRYPKWVETWYHLEALSSLANFAFLNPDYSFPDIVNDNKTQAIFSGKELGHPLLKKEKKIHNDFTFNSGSEIAIITGSNMSGKSTFIRTIGVNLSLAYAGSVVNAQELTVSLFRLFTCIKVSDSVIDGISYFYAEVKRLKALLDEIEESEYPVLFLIDEIFRGTNNIERLKGSSAFIKKLAQTKAIGAVATHDLELVKLSEEISRVKNYHFREEIKEGKMIFDYRLNNGPCPTTNALKIMKLEGLPVN